MKYLVLFNSVPWQHDKQTQPWGDLQKHKYECGP